eukprot:1019186-Pleurochrysis_carterae.AAC.2
MIVDEHEQVLITGVLCADEGSGDIRVDQAARMRWFVERRIVGMTSGICRGAGRTAVETTMRKRRRGVRGYGR